MLDKKIIIVGGSIAGCAMAALLKTLGLDVIVLEKSGGELVQGTGIFLPEMIINQCIDLDLFDEDIPRLKISDRSFRRKTDGGEELFWQQPLKGFSFNWGSVYANLRKRISPQDYKTHSGVIEIIKVNDQYQIAVQDGTTYYTDLIIAADGINSSVRSSFAFETQPKYTDYYAWRGVLKMSADVQEMMLAPHLPYYVFEGGHILLYPIPDHNHPGGILLNWVMYQHAPDLSLSELLIDKAGNQHAYSLPPGGLSEQKIKELKEFAKDKLPTKIAELIHRTEQPFIQAVFDCELPSCCNENILFTGDAATVLRPHTASGVFKALQSAIECFNIVRENLDKDIPHLLELWAFKQKEILKGEITKAFRMGELLVTKTPEWAELTGDKMQELWEMSMKGFSWYAASSFK